MTSSTGESDEKVAAQPTFEEEVTRRVEAEKRAIDEEVKRRLEAQRREIAEADKRREEAERNARYLSSHHRKSQSIEAVLIVLALVAFVVIWLVATK